MPDADQRPAVKSVGVPYADYLTLKRIAASDPPRTLQDLLSKAVGLLAREEGAWDVESLRDSE